MKIYNNSVTSKGETLNIVLLIALDIIVYSTNMLRKYFLKSKPV